MHRRQDRLHYAFDILQHIIVPETQDETALRSKINRSLCISGNVLRLIVLRSIDLDDDTGESGEVRFKIKNNGPSVHEFVVFKTDLASFQKIFEAYIQQRTAWNAFEIVSVST